jgi:hypothetical protein
VEGAVPIGPLQLVAPVPMRTRDQVQADLALTSIYQRNTMAYNIGTGTRDVVRVKPNLKL